MVTNLSSVVAELILSSNFFCFSKNTTYPLATLPRKTNKFTVQLIVKKKMHCF